MSQNNHDVLSAAHPQEWARAEHLLPGYLKKTLPESDQEWMKQWTSQIQSAGGQSANALAAETAWTLAAQDALARQAADFNVETGWTKLAAGLQYQPDQPAQPALSTSQRFKNWVAKLVRMQQDKALQWWQKPAIGALASAMIVGQMGFLAATVKQVYVLTTDTSMVTPSAGGSRPVDGVLLKVIFKSNASVKDMSATLNSVQGRVTGGPGALGVWEVEVPADKLAVALQTLSKAKTVESVAQD